MRISRKLSMGSQSSRLHPDSRPTSPPHEKLQGPRQIHRRPLIPTTNKSSSSTQPSTQPKMDSPSQAVDPSQAGDHLRRVAHPLRPYAKGGLPLLLHLPLLLPFLLVVPEGDLLWLLPGAPDFEMWASSEAQPLSSRRKP